MIQTVKAIIDRDGNVHLLELVKLKMSRRALVTILEEDAASEASETALLSERALAADWNKPEEDQAWSHFQPAR